MTTPRRRPPDRFPGLAISAGRPYPMGATIDHNGINFALFSAHATSVELCLFSDDGDTELCRIPLPARSGDIWHAHIAGIAVGQRYGYRVHGPFAPKSGDRFNPNKLLIDPYARQLDRPFGWSDHLLGYNPAAPERDLSFDPRDSARFVPKSIVTDPSFDWGDDTTPCHPIGTTVIYEAHAKGLTKVHPNVPPAQRGTYLGLCSDPILDHLTKLGVTTIELLPVHAFFDDQFLVAKAKKNYWGYQSLGFFAPEPRYMSHNAVLEFQTMVRRLHGAGIEVILDVVYNHSGEGDELGPTLAFRGLDNSSYYRLQDNKRYYANDAGTGNTLDLTHPMVLRMVLDSLRYWVEVMHVDGFRFDLATVLAREAHGFDPRGGFLDAIAQDPVLNRVRLIAEPWDLGPGGYQLGAWPFPFLEWNDQFRDDVRRFWRGDTGMIPDLAKRLLGSAEKFDHSGRHAHASVNFVTAHDGFTLEDLVSYAVKNNLANGEDNRDGHNANHSDNMGHEGGCAPEPVRLARDHRKRNLLATLMLSQGTPMLLAGDELGNSQGGNNNAYAQDNEIGWVNWPKEPSELMGLISDLTALRRAHPVLRQSAFLHGEIRDTDQAPDVKWYRADGAPPNANDWHAADFLCLCVDLRMERKAELDDRLYIVFNGGAATTVTLPPSDTGWRKVLDTALPRTGPLSITGPTASIGHGVMVFEPD